MNPLFAMLALAFFLLAVIIAADAWRDRARFSAGGRA